MEITEVRIKLMDDAGERLQAFCSITFDHCFVIRDLKIIGGANGAFVAMPSRRLTAHCHRCGCKNHLKAAYCNQCGGRLRQDTSRDDEGRAKLYADIAHPINQACRDLIQQKVIEAFHLEQERAKQPGYVSSYDDFDDDVAPQPRRPGGSRHGDTRSGDPRGGEARQEQRHGGERRESDRREVERRETNVRKVPPQDPPGATSLGQAAPGQMQKVEPPTTEPRAPHSNVGVPSGTEKPKPTGFGEGVFKKSFSLGEKVSMCPSTDEGRCSVCKRSALSKKLAPHPSASTPPRSPTGELFNTTPQGRRVQLPAPVRFIAR